MHHILSSDQSTLPENVHIVDMICINLNAYNTQLQAHASSARHPTAPTGHTQTALPPQNV